MAKKKVIIYRDQLLPASNTFVQKQAEFLKSYDPVYFGSREENNFRSSGLNIWMPNYFLGALNYLEQIHFKVFDGVPSYVREFRKRFGQEIPQMLVHAHFGPDGLLASVISEYLQIPLIVTFHGYEVTIKEPLLKKYSYRDRKFVQNKQKLNDQAFQFIAVSKFLKDRMIERGFDEAKIIQHYIGVDVDFFQPIWKKSASKKILFVGRLVEKKGLEYLLKSLVLVKRKISDVSLEIIGDGHLKSKLVRLAEELKLPCVFHGAKNSEFVKERLAQSRTLCVPSIIAANGDAESFGIVFAEAQAMGVPVVSFGSGGIPEVVIHNETGLLAEEKNIEELANHLETVLMDDVLANRFSKNGIENIHERFNLKKQTLKLEDVYDNAKA